MATGLSVKVEGLDELEKQLGALDKKIRKKFLRQALRAAAKPIRDEAARLAPRRTSEPPRTSGKPLHRSMVIRSAGKQPGSDITLQVAPGKGASHGLLQEFGTVHHPAQPFLRPAFDNKRDEAVRAFRESLGKNIEQEAARLNQ